MGKKDGFDLKKGILEYKVMEILGLTRRKYNRFDNEMRRLKMLLRREHKPS